jgi:uncharacterized protein (DUF305 family)
LTPYVAHWHIVSPVRRALLAAAAALAALAVVTACGNNDMGGMNPGSSGQSATSASTAASFNNADVQFAQMMVPHHQQAVEMATLAETRASDPQIKQLAAQITAAQAPEIKILSGWLAAWANPRPRPAACPA